MELRISPIARERLASDGLLEVAGAHTMPTYPAESDGPIFFQLAAWPVSIPQPTALAQSGFGLVGQKTVSNYSLRSSPCLTM
jgi:hypothetical protein